ncbi:MAG TPA: dienelactone hydrolase family protein [Xanthomonadaceae bacterium]|nr:dienelactone hydrolase family protein [Xanthomonadaceae bacterium]
MGEWHPLTTARGDVQAWLARPEQAPRGAVVVIQEIFGVTAHIRDVTERFAAAGFTAMAPAFFDVLRPGVELAYDEAGMNRGRELVGELGLDGALEVVGAAAHWLRESGHRVGAVGYCWGGSVAFLANTRLGLPAVSYYGARNVPFLVEPARAPLMFHFGGKDRSITPGDIDEHRARQPQAQLFVYPDAGHAFNRDVDPHVYEPASAKLAWQRTLDFFAGHLR